MTFPRRRLHHVLLIIATSVVAQIVIAWLGVFIASQCPSPVSSCNVPASAVTGFDISPFTWKQVLRDQSGVAAVRMTVGLAVTVTELHRPAASSRSRPRILAERLDAGVPWRSLSTVCIFRGDACDSSGPAAIDVEIGDFNTLMPLPRSDMQVGGVRPLWLDGPGAAFVAAIPLRIQWPQFIANTFFWAAMACVIVHLPRALRTRARVRAGRCARCNYDLQGQIAGAFGQLRCPECGGVFARRNGSTALSASRH